MIFFLLQVCDIQGNLQDGSQVVVSVIFENKCSSFLKSMEFNVLDSLNSKLQRPEGSGPHDGLTVPFQLPPGQCLNIPITGSVFHSCKSDCKLLILLINLTQWSRVYRIGCFLKITLDRQTLQSRLLYFILFFYNNF